MLFVVLSIVSFEVDRTGTSDTVEGQSSNLELYPRSDWQPVKSVTKHRCDVFVFADTNDHTSDKLS